MNIFRVKKLYLFVLQTFLPLFLATFGVCLFIILMQFLWKYVDDMVGKGLAISVLGEMFFFAALAFVPLALPLAILLASLMAFGNLGERMELLAMKAAGISLIQVMRPLIVVIIIVAIGAFYFQNNILPMSQVKLWTMVYSMKQKSPELEIPEGSFYKEIPGYNVYIEHKNPKTGIMYDMMIYDFSKGFENAVVIVADSGKLGASEDKFYLVLTLYNGESFENLNSQRSRSINEKIPYRRETFQLKQVLIKFDGNFNMADESIMGDRDIAKNINQLRSFIDSTEVTVDSMSRANAVILRNYTYRGALENPPDKDTVIPVGNKDPGIKDFDGYYSSKRASMQLNILNQARSKAESIRNDFQFRTINQIDNVKLVRGHKVELYRKFTLSVACLVFLFIGAPLGAIIRKGGLGMPTVISVFLFLFYYVVDIVGIKLAKQGVLPVWQGMWLSSVVLFGLGFFITYKAVNDSTMFNPDVWTNFLKRVFRLREVRNYQRKEVIMNNPDYSGDLERIGQLDELCNNYLNERKHVYGYIGFWKKGFRNTELEEIRSRMEDLIEDLRNSDQNLILGKLMDYPVLLIPKVGFFDNRVVRIIFAILLPVGVLIYLLDLLSKKRTRQDVAAILKLNDSLAGEIKKLM